MKIYFTPDPTTTKADTIAFVQIAKVTYTDSKKPFLFPNETSRVTADGWSIDRRAGNRLGWYGYGNPPEGPSSTIIPGNAKSRPVTPAFMKDFVNSSKCPTNWRFQTFVIAKNGNGGEVLSGLSWGFDVDKDGMLTEIQPELVKKYKDFEDAIKMWNKQASGPIEERNAKDQIPFDGFTLPGTRDGS